MRRLLPALALLAALVFALPAEADLRPVRRDFGELHVPRLRAGQLRVPRGAAHGRIQVVVQLADVPLARYAPRTLSAGSGRRKVDVRSATSRAYLALLARRQAVAAAQLRDAIPDARVRRRYRIVLNGLAVELPARDLPRLLRLALARKVSPSVRYTLRLNESPAIIGAAQLVAATGARGEGLKIAVVDDGIDPGNPFFAPAGFAYPAGFPRGGRRWTTPKVIVARVFPGAGSGPGGRLALDPDSSFHGTHVAGIAAGVAGTTARSGADHPATAGLSGVAPRAWLGNYRVFTVPTPIGNVANTPEILAAFEAAVADGMDVVNFSAGGPEIEPRSDPVVDAIASLAAAGVVPVVSAGNERDDFGFGSAASPGTAPEAISVAATSNNQVFAQALRVTAAGRPEALAAIPFQAAAETAIPAAWTSSQTLVDVGSIVGTDGSAVDRALCGPPGRPNSGPGTLPAGSLVGAIALGVRGTCTFASKARRARAAGAIGLVLGDNRPGEAGRIPLPLAVPAGMVSDLDAARLRAHMAGSGGRTTVAVGRGIERLETGRGGVITSFSSAAPTAFGHVLKPDVSAPGGQILSSTTARFFGPFAVFDGTSMSAPHVAGAAALLLERHPTWTPRQVKSALMATAGSAWADTARTVEAPVTLQGAGLVDLPAADDPRVFTQPSSLSFGDLDAVNGSASRALSVLVSDAGGGAGDWQVEVRVQAATAGAALVVPGPLALAPGGDAFLTAVAQAAPGAEPGENYGLVLLRQGTVTRRIPYFFLVARSPLAGVGAVPLRPLQEGTTAGEGSKVSAYRYPTWAFGAPPDYLDDPPMEQNGRERLYATTLDRRVANFGVSVVAASAGAVVDPWVLGSADENDVQGYSGTPINVNSLTFGYGADIGAAGAVLPQPGTYYVSVDSGRDVFTGESLAGRYLLRAWVDDVKPPAIAPVTRRVSAGRPTLVARVVDARSGVDPLSLAIAYRGVIVGASAYDPFTGLAVFGLPRQAPALRPGRVSTIVVASDFQEAKNSSTTGEETFPNTWAIEIPLKVVRGPAVTWLEPRHRACVPARAGLLVAASSTAPVRSVRFFVDRRRLGVVRRGPGQLYALTWRRGADVQRGRHVLRAVVLDARGRTAAAERVVRVC